MRLKLLFIPLLFLFIFFILVTATTVQNSPTACSGSWTNCVNAFADNTNRATTTASSSSNVSGTWTTYGFSLPANAQVTSVRVRADFFASKTNGFIDVRTSDDGGTSYGQLHTAGGNTAEQTFWLDVTNDHAWNATKLDNTNFKVRATCFKKGSGPNPTCNLDWIPVEVNYSVPPAPSFDFNVSAAPTSTTVPQAQSAQTTVTVLLLSGNTQTVSLSYAGCPPSTTCSFSPATGSPTYTSTFTAATSSTTPTGTYQLNLTGTDGTLSRTAAYTVTVTDSQPIASASAQPTSGTAPLVVNFTGGVTGGDNPLTYVWDFADTTNSTSQHPVHNFTASGDYNVSFTATDFDGDLSTSYVLVSVA